MDLGSAVADANGTVTFTVTLPTDIEPGEHRITFEGPESGAVWAEFDVPQPATQFPGDTVPGTWRGAVAHRRRRTPGPGGSAVLLLLAGVFLVTRRRRTEY
ncbi:hypothetical protein NKG05_11180 [Oerskovia sp. M15]